MLLRIHLERDVGYTDIVKPIGLRKELPGFGRRPIDILERLWRGKGEFVRSNPNNVAYTNCTFVSRKASIICLMECMNTIFLMSFTYELVPPS